MGVMLSAALNKLLHDLRQISEGAWVVFKGWWMWFALLLADGILIMLILKNGGGDLQGARTMMLADGSGWAGLARFLSFWGDWPTGTLLFCVVAWFVGFLKNSRKWQILALACLLGSAAAGIGANTLRVSFGRPRPATEKPDGFYGPLAVMKFDQREDLRGWRLYWHYANSMNRYQSWPSGHAATSSGMAIAATVVNPVVGVPLLAVAGGGSWSRMALGRHYPSDIVNGWIFGLAGGLCFGLAGRRMLASRLRKPGVIEPEIVP